MSLQINDFLQCGMGKRTKLEPREIFLGDWLDHFGIGPTEAAGIAGCTQSYISNISRGARDNVNVLYLLKLSEYLDVNVNDFFRPLPNQSQLAAIKNPESTGGSAWAPPPVKLSRTGSCSRITISLL